MLTRSKNGHLPPKSHFCLTATVQDQPTSEPFSVQEALQSPIWTQAMIEEHQALLKQGTWTLVPLPPDKHRVGCKWVFKIKGNSDSTISRYKARLVAKGYLQEEGLDYQETFSLVAKHLTIRILLCMDLYFNWTIKQLDISNAFLHGTLSEEVYLSQPLGFISSQYPNHVYKLNKALYDLK